MISKILILLLSLTIFSQVLHVQSRPLDCRDGEKYWCLSIRNARRCKKEKYCQEIWNLRTESEVRVMKITPPKSWFDRIVDAW